jgi:hypothetical protein
MNSSAIRKVVAVERVDPLRLADDLLMSQENTGKFSCGFPTALVLEKNPLTSDTV